MTTHQKLRLLLVDADPAIHEYFDQHFEHEFEIYSCDHGFKALQRVIAEGPFAMIVASQHLPGLPGVDLLGRVHALHPDSIRILLVETPTFELASQATNLARVWRLMEKPLDTVELTEVLRTGERHFQKTQEKEDVVAEKIHHLQNELIRMDRFAQIGTLASGIGHEFNNLAVISRALLDEMIEARDADTPLRPDAVDEMTWIGERIEGYASQFMTLGHTQCMSTPRILDLGELFASTLETLQLLGRLRYLQVEYTCTGCPIEIHGVEAEITQVVMNLINYAADKLEHSGQRSTIALRLERDLVPHHATLEIRNFADPTNNPIADISLFDTQHVDISRDLTLSVARGIIESHGGQLSSGFNSEDGSWIRVSLPLHICEESTFVESTAAFDDAAE